MEAFPRLRSIRGYAGLSSSGPAAHRIARADACVRIRPGLRAAAAEGASARTLEDQLASTPALVPATQLLWTLACWDFSPPSRETFEMLGDLRRGAVRLAGPYPIEPGSPRWRALGRGRVDARLAPLGG